MGSVTQGFGGYKSQVGAHPPRDFDYRCTPGPSPPTHTRPLGGRCKEQDAEVLPSAW